MRFLAARSSGARVLAVVALAGVALLLLASSAAAARIGASGPGPGQFANLDAVAVSSSEGGDIYTTDGRSNRVEQFTPAGGFVRAFGWGVVPGAASGHGDLIVGSTTIRNVTTAGGEFTVGQMLTAPGIPGNDRIVQIGEGEIKLSRAATASGTGVELTVAAGPGNVPTNEVQTLTVKATAGTYQLTFQSPWPDSTRQTTAAIPATASYEEVEQALEGLSNIGAGNVSVSGGPGNENGTSPYLVEFLARYADSDLRTLRVAEASLSGGAAEATIATRVEGGGVLETCTAVCWEEIQEQAEPSGIGFGSLTGLPGQMDYADEIAVDNSCAEQEPPVTGAACENLDPAYGDVYVLDQRNYRVERYSPDGHFELMFGGEVDKGPHHPGDLCTAAYIAEGDECGAGVPGTGPAHFHSEGFPRNWADEGFTRGEHNNSLAVGPDGTVYVGDFGRIQEFSAEGTFAGELAPPDETTVEGQGNLAKGSAVLTAVSAAIGTFVVGQPIVGPGIPPDTQILAVGSGTLTLSKSATESLTASPLAVTPQFVTALALDAAGDVYERSAIYDGGGSISQIPGIREYGPGPAHALIRTFDAEQSGTEPTHVALDSAGDLFVTDFAGGFIRPSCTFQETANCPEARFRAFRPDGQLYAIFTSPEVITPSPTANPRSIAFSAAAGDLYATVELAGSQYVTTVTPPVPGPPLVKQGSEEAANIEPTTTVLHAVVNPNGFDTKYRVEYVTQAHFEAEGFESSEKTPLKDLGAVIQEDTVSVPLSNLHPDTTYRWRVFAENEKHEVAEGEAAEFTSLPAVSARDFTTQTVGPELVTLKAELNPNNGIGTEYTFRYGATEAYEGGTLGGTLPIGGEFKPVQATFTGLNPNTTYHYQLTVRNSNGAEVSTDRTFTTELSSAEELAAEDCPANGSLHGQPNSTIREEDSSLALPDCRAYEQVTEVEKNGGFTNFEAMATDGERIFYKSTGAFAGAAANQLGIQYLAQRMPSGWVTQPVIRRLAPPPTEPFSFSLTLSPELDRWIYPESEGYGGEEARLAATSSYFSLGTADGGSRLHASPTIGPLDGTARYLNDFTTVADTSRDLSDVLILTGTRLLAEDPRPDGNVAGQIPPQADRLYELTGVGGEAPSILPVAEVPVGLRTTSNGFGGAGGCFLDWQETVRTGIGHAAGDLIHEPRTMDESGSMILYTAPIERAEGLGCGEGNPNPYGLFACHVAAGPCVEGLADEQHPVQLNAPPPSQCSMGHLCFQSGQNEPRTPLYDGASRNGRYVWFTTTQPLLNADADNTNDLYVAKLAPNGQLEELVQASAGVPTGSHPNPGEGADVGEDGVSQAGGLDAINQGVLSVSADGTHAAFESPAVLTEEPNALGQRPVQHANNVYEYDLTTNKTKFITDLCSSPGRSGTEPGQVAAGHEVTAQQSVPDPACPATVGRFISGFLPQGEFRLWGHAANEREVTLTPNGRFLLFVGLGRFTPGDTDNQADIFRYDFETGDLIRVSVGRRGNDGNGNDDRYPAEFPQREVISDDGSTIIFRTPAPLVSTDTNQTSSEGSCQPGSGAGANPTGCDIYEWEEQGHGTCSEAGGCVSLISSGRTPHLGDWNARIDASGRNIFFQTDRGLVPNDTDGVADTYDARIEGGFHPVHPQPPCASPEACGTGFARPAAPPVIGTPSFVGSGNSATQLECAKGRRRVVKHGQVRCVRIGRHRPRHHHRRRHHRHRAGSGR